MPGAKQNPDKRQLGLTAREWEVTKWLVEGKRDREIAIILGVSPRTVQNHVASILHKLQTETRTGAARVVHEHMGKNQNE